MPHLRRVGSRLAYQKAAGRVAAAAASSSAEPSPALTATASSRQGAPLFLQAHDGSQTPDPGHDPEETVADRRRRESSRRAASALVGLSQRARHARAPTTVKREEGEGEEEDSTNTSIEMSTADMDEADFEEVEITDEAEPSVKLEDSQAAPLPPEPEHEVIEIKDESSDEGFQELSCFSASATPAEPPATNVPPPPSTPKKPRRQPNKRKAAVARLTDDTGGPSRPSTARQGSRERNQASPAPRPVLARDFDWPEHFLNLERTFKAVNTVYAFCSARKHLATTYDTIKSSVEGLLKRPLEVFDVAQIKSLCPDLINFAYVEHDLLQVHLDVANSGPSEPKTYRERAAARRAHRDDVYADAAAAVGLAHASQSVDGAGMPTAGGGWQDDAEANLEGGPTGPLMAPAEIGIPTAKGKEKKREEYVLLLEFNDGTLQGPKATAKGKRMGNTRKKVAPPQKSYKQQVAEMPSPGQMQKLISKRHFKFEQAALELLTACRAKDEDPVQLLLDAAHDHVPVNPETSGRVEGDSPQKKRIRLERLMLHPEERSDVNEIIDEMKAMPWWKEQIVPGGHRVFEQREATYDDLEFQLSQALVDALYATTQIEKFYTHQAEALNALHDGYNVIVSTSTSSGKSLIYQIPVLQALENDPNSTALYIFPTKALAQDQRRSLQDLLTNCEGLEDMIVATYDGDTQKEERQEVRERANVIFTNPDMLHQSILPSEDLWRRFLRNLKYVVVDELHTYNGLFGAHVSFIMRRLRRICNALGNRCIKFVSCSATVANPSEHMQTLFGVEDVKVVTKDGSPTGKKEWVVWNPPHIDPEDPAQGRVSAYAEVSRVFRHLVERGVRTIVFTKVRRTCEIVIRQIRSDLLLEDRADVASKVMAYRSGYSPQDRRKIEQDMFKGSLLGIVATSALELGIDIGSLDAVIMLGFPYSISSLRQQAGRAGRRQKDSLAVLVGDPFPTDQYYMNNPDEIFTQPDAALSVDLGNDFVLEAHLQCAAEEMPIHPEDDQKYFGERLPVLCKTRLVGDEHGFYHCREELRPNPSREVAIRGARQETYAYIDDTPGLRGGPRVMEEVEVDRAIFEAFEGAVFMHQGLSYICKEISHDTRIARMVQADVNWHTRPRDITDVDASETHRIRALRDSPYRAYYGRVTVTTLVWGYFKVDRRANILDAVDVDCPPFVRDTHGLWIDVPMWIVDALTEKTINAAAAIHAAEHALLSLTPMFVVSMAGDVRTECKVAEKEYAKRTSTRKRPARLTFYDTPGQNGGICAKAFDHLDGLFRIAIAVIEACPCVEGCPACVTSNTCAHANLVTSKVGALGVLRGLVGREPFDDDMLPQQNEPGIAPGMLERHEQLNHTIMSAPPVRTARDGPPVEVEVVEEQMPPSLQALDQLMASQQASAGSSRTKGKSLLFEE